MTFDQIPFISEAKFQKLREGKLRPGDLVMTVRGTIGNSALFTGEFYRTAFINAQMMIIRPRTNRVLSAFLLQLIQSPYFKGLLAFRAFGSAQQQLTNQLLSTLPLPVPPIEEQEEISFAIADSLSASNDLLDRVQHEISLLHEHRTRLVADVVTGKLDVREAAARLPEEAKEPEAVAETDALDGAVDEGSEEPEMELEGAGA